PALPAAWITYRLFSRRATLVTAVSRTAADDARRVSGRADVPLLPNGLDRAVWAVRPKADAADTTVRLKADTTYTEDTTGPQTDTSDRESFDGDSLVCRVRRQPDRGALRPDAGVLRVVSVMRLAGKKSPGDLIDAVAAVLARVRRHVVLTIVGDGPERERLERQARRLGVASQVEFLGACAPVRVAEVLPRSSVFALPSRREAFGIAVLEARAAGLPIVAYASGA